MPAGRKKAPKKTLKERVLTPQFRDLALASIPVAYGFGYFVWAFYAASQDLGFLPLSSPRYLTVGLVFGLYLGLALGLSPYLVKHAWRENKRAKADVLHVVASICTTFLAYLLFISIPEAFQMFSTTWHHDLAGYLVAPVSAVLAAILYLGHWGYVRLRWTVKKAGTYFRSVAQSRPASSRPRAPDSYLGIYYCILVFFLFVLCTLVFLPAMRPEFGGAQVRHASFELAQDDVSLSLGAMLWLPGQNMSAPVLRTVELPVYYYDSQSFLIRLPSEGLPGPLYELERSLVHGIVWKAHEGS